MQGYFINKKGEKTGIFTHYGGCHAMFIGTYEGKAAILLPSSLEDLMHRDPDNAGYGAWFEDCQMAAFAEEAEKRHQMGSTALSVCLGDWPDKFLANLSI